MCDEQILHHHQFGVVRGGQRVVDTATSTREISTFRIIAELCGYLVRNVLNLVSVEQQPGSKVPYRLYATRWHEQSKKMLSYSDLVPMFELIN